MAQRLDEDQRPVHPLNTPRPSRDQYSVLLPYTPGAAGGTVKHLHDLTHGYTGAQFQDFCRGSQWAIQR